jgi:hypothetical protein
MGRQLPGLDQPNGDTGNDGDDDCDKRSRTPDVTEALWFGWKETAA